MPSGSVVSGALLILVGAFIVMRTIRGERTLPDLILGDR